MQGCYNVIRAAILKIALCDYHVIVIADPLATLLYVYLFFPYFTQNAYGHSQQQLSAKVKYSGSQKQMSNADDLI